MNRTLLALKVTTQDLTSAWIETKILVVQYKVGELIQAPHPELGLFLATDTNDQGRLATGCYYSKVLVVKIKEDDISRRSPWGLWSMPEGEGFSTIPYPKTPEQAAENSVFSSTNYLTVSKLKVLSVHDEGESIEKIMSDARKKYKLAFVKNDRERYPANK